MQVFTGARSKIACGTMMMLSALAELRKKYKHVAQPPLSAILDAYENGDHKFFSDIAKSLEQNGTYKAADPSSSAVYDFLWRNYDDYPPNVPTVQFSLQDIQAICSTYGERISLRTAGRIRSAFGLKSKPVGRPKKRSA